MVRTDPSVLPRVPGTARYRPLAENAETIHGDLAAHRDEVLRRSPYTAYTGAVTDYLDGNPDVVGAATVARYFTGYDPGRAVPPRPGRMFVDTWVLDHGPAFAAEAALELDKGWSWEVDEVLVHLRQAVLGGGEPEYRAVVARLAGHRDTTQGRALSAFLAPTETAWVDAACAELGTQAAPGRLTSLVLCSVTTTAQLDAMALRQSYPL